MGRFRKSAERVDLSETSDFFLALKEDPHVWRERLVAELRLGLRNHVRSINAFQVEFTPELLRRFVDIRSARTGNVLLPLTTREKRPLLNFSVSGPAGAPATVLPRASIAALQTLYLVSLVDRVPQPEALWPYVDERLWEAICQFSPSFFVSNFYEQEEEDMVQALTTYLRKGLDFEVEEDQVVRWRQRTEEAAQVLASSLGELRDRFSSSEEVLLALPDMSPLPTSAAEVDGIVESFARAVQAADGVGAVELLYGLAEYGRRYELIVEVEVPLLESSRLRVEEDLPLELERRRTQYWVRQSIALNETRSAHLEARLDDSNVEFPERRDRGQDLSIEVTDPDGHVVTGWMEAVRVTREALAVYSSEPDRPNRVHVAFRLRMASHLVWTTVVLSLLNVAAVVLALSMGGDDELASRLAVIAVPTTVAGGFVIVREQTALATRLQAWPRIALALTTVSVWAAVSLRLLLADPSLPKTPDGEHPTDSSHLSTTVKRAASMNVRSGAKMAKNVARAKSQPGNLRGRTLTRDPKTGLWTKRSAVSGKFMDVKRSSGAFKGVRREG